jgi:hypothetical protein
MFQHFNSWRCDAMFGRQLPTLHPSSGQKMDVVCTSETSVNDLNEYTAPHTSGTLHSHLHDSLSSHIIIPVIRIFSLQKARFTSVIRTVHKGVGTIVSHACYGLTSVTPFTTDTVQWAGDRRNNSGIVSHRLGFHTAHAKLLCVCNRKTFWSIKPLKSIQSNYREWPLYTHICTYLWAGIAKLVER